MRKLCVGVSSRSSECIKRIDWQLRKSLCLTSGRPSSPHRRPPPAINVYRSVLITDKKLFLRGSIQDIVYTVIVVTRTHPELT